MTGDVPLTHENVVESATEPGAAQPKSLDSLAKLVPDNRRALDDPLAEQGVCPVATTTPCTWIPSPGGAETQLCEISWRRKIFERDLSLI